MAAKVGGLRSMPYVQRTRKGVRMADNRYTSIYLGEEARSQLEALAAASGQSMSLVVRGLIAGATNSPEARVNELVGELADLLHLR